ncbi:hypothetical protein [Alteromonas flava]|uniref:hypothetical protein n=1 Tax=Alteromonas flava TaxID=2048003 RepID=UPI000F5F7646|nr:hypothetical protein [Alteromonas flava]
MQKAIITLSLMTIGLSASLPALANANNYAMLNHQELHIAIAENIEQNLQALEMPAMQQEIAAMLKQSTVQHQIEQHLDLARQALPRNQFKVVIGE